MEVNWLVSWQGLLDLCWLLLLLAILFYFWRERKQLADAKYWLITKGRVTLFEWTKNGHQLWPKIEFTYYVFDQEFRSKYLFLDTVYNNPNSKYARQVAYKAAVAYEKDAEIDVYYNPDNPQQAVLDVTVPPKLNLIIVLLLLLIFFHLFIIIRRLLS